MTTTVPTSARPDPAGGPTVDPILGPVHPPAHLDVIAARVEADLGRVLDAEHQRWTAVDPDLGPPLLALRRLLTGGGKRLRPAFCTWGFVAAGGSLGDGAPRQALDQAAVAFELLHAFALIHDDVMDDSDRRRGEPTAHTEFSGYHAAGGWRGETRRFGESAAILIGDLAHVYANEAMRDQAPATAAVWRELQTELMMGQYLDVLGTAQADRSVRRARLVMRLKSGRYTVEQPLRIGAAIATGRSQPASVTDAAPKHLRAVPAGSDATDGRDHRRIDDLLARYGQPLGVAFQLRDDVLGAFGDTATIGKPVGDDLREGKPTSLLAHATERADPAARTVLGRVGSDSLTDADIERIQTVLIDTGALRLVERDIARLTDEAVTAIDQPVVPDDARRALVDLARYIEARES